MNRETPVIVPDQKATSADKQVAETVWRVGAAAGIVLLAGMILLLNVYPHRIGIVRNLAHPSSFVPLLAPGFETHVAGLTAWLGLGIVLNAFHLAYGRWRPWTRWFEWATNIVGVGVLLPIVRGGPIVGLDPAWLARQELAAAEIADLERLVSIGDIIARLAVGGVALGLGIAVVVGLLRGLREGGIIGESE